MRVLHATRWQPKLQLFLGQMEGVASAEHLVRIWKQGGMFLVNLALPWGVTLGLSGEIHKNIW